MTRGHSFCRAIEEADRVRIFEEYLARQKAKAEEKEKRHREKDDKDKVSFHSVQVPTKGRGGRKQRRNDRKKRVGGVFNAAIGELEIRRLWETRSLSAT